MLNLDLIPFSLIVVLIVFTGLFYLIILWIKNFVSRKNLKRALGINFGRYSIPGNKSHSIEYSYINQYIDRGPNVDFFIMCAGTYKFADFIVVRERVFDKIFKILGISSELQTGYRWFDKRYYIVSETNKTKQQHLLADEQVCKIIARLLSEGFDYIQLKEGVVKVGYSTFTGWRWFKPGVVKRSATLLTQLCDSLEKHRSENKRLKRVQSLSSGSNNIEGFVHFYIRPSDKTFKHYPKKWVRQRKFWMSSSNYVLCIGMFFMVIGVYFDPYPAIEFKQVFNTSVLYLFFPVMLLHLLAAGIHLSGRARTHKELSWIAVLNGVGYSFVAVFGFQILNGALDNSPVMSHPSKLIRTDHTRSSKGPDSYFIIVKSWRNSNTEKLPVSEFFYNLSVNRINKTVNILTKAGTFNVEWLYGYHFDIDALRPENR